MTNKKITLFHLDDSTIARKIFKNYFYGDFTEVIDAGDIESSLEILIQGPDIDCFVMDLNIGEVTSLKLIEKINSIKKYYLSPIILRTADLTQQVAHQAMKCGVNESISKLVPPRELKKVILEQIENPTTKYVTQEFYEISCATWEKEGVFYQYCPELSELFSGKSQQETKKKVEMALKDYLKSGGKIKGDIRVSQDLCQIKI